jgi:hypothetical protein
MSYYTYANMLKPEKFPNLKHFPAQAIQRRDTQPVFLSRLFFFFVKIINEIFFLSIYNNFSIFKNLPF